MIGRTKARPPLLLEQARFATPLWISCVCVLWPILASLTPRFEQPAKDHLGSLDPVQVPLRINCRNTRVILNGYRTPSTPIWTYTGSEPEPVSPSASRARPTRRESAAREIGELVDMGGPAPGSVRILSRLDLVESSVALMPRTRYAGSGGWASAP